MNKLCTLNYYLATLQVTISDSRKPCRKGDWWMCANKKVVKSAFLFFKIAYFENLIAVHHKTLPRQHAQIAVPKIKIRLRMWHAIEIRDNTGRIDIICRQKDCY